MTTRVGFAVGTGRCGTHFLHHLLAAEPAVASHHERHPLSDSFQRYCRWYSLPVDPAGFLEHKRQGIAADHRNHRLSFEASAYLSLDINLLYRQFNARFVFLVRHPHDVIASLHKKGWYEQPLHREDPNLAPAIQPWQEKNHHSFSRIVPHQQPDAGRWARYTRIGKLAWYWRRLNEAVLSQFETIPAENRMVVRLEDLDHEKYKQITGFLGVESKLSTGKFRKIRDTKASSLQPDYSMRQWPDESVNEYRREVSELAAQLDYPV